MLLLIMNVAARHTAMIVGSIQDTWQVQPDRKGGAPNLKGKHVHHHHHDQYTQRMVFSFTSRSCNIHVRNQKSKSSPIVNSVFE